MPNDIAGTSRFGGSPQWLFRAPDRPGRAVEGREDAVAHRLHLASDEARELAADHGVVGVEQVSPAAVAELTDEVGRADDVAEQDRRQNAVDIDVAHAGLDGQIPALGGNGR